MPEENPFPYSLWDPLADVVRGKKVCIIENRNSMGDKFLEYGGQVLLRELGARVVTVGMKDSRIPSCDILAWGGGANISGRYNRHPVRAAEIRVIAGERGIPFILLPHGIEHWSESLDLFDHVFLRDSTSVAMCPGSVLVPDMALALYGKIHQNHIPKTVDGSVFRDDCEKSGEFEECDAWRDMYFLRDFLRACATFRTLKTDFLHTAICSALMGAEVELFAVDWHKNQSMFDTWLHLLPNCSYSG